MKSKRKEQGFTVMEMMVVLAMTALLLSVGIGIGVGIYDRLDRVQFEAECEVFLEEIIAVRNKGLMGFSEPSVCKIYQKYAWFSYFDAKGKQHHKRMDFKHFSISGITGVFEVVFYSTGTISRSKTLRLVSKKGKTKMLVVQVATGRIYLTDEN